MSTRDQEPPRNPSFPGAPRRGLIREPEYEAAAEELFTSAVADLFLREFEQKLVTAADLDAFPEDANGIRYAQFGRLRLAFFIDSKAVHMADLMMEEVSPCPT